MAVLFMPEHILPGATGGYVKYNRLHVVQLHAGIYLALTCFALITELTKTLCTPYLSHPRLEIEFFVVTPHSTLCQLCDILD